MRILCRQREHLMVLKTIVPLLNYTFIRLTHLIKISEMWYFITFDSKTIIYLKCWCASFLSTRLRPGFYQQQYFYEILFSSFFPGKHIFCKRVLWRFALTHAKGSLREKCPNTELFLVRIWTLFTQCMSYFEVKM